MAEDACKPTHPLVGKEKVLLLSTSALITGKTVARETILESEVIVTMRGALDVHSGAPFFFRKELPGIVLPQHKATKEEHDDAESSLFRYASRILGHASGRGSRVHPGPGPERAAGRRCPQGRHPGRGSEPSL